MSTAVASPPLDDFVSGLFDRAPRRRALSVLGWAAAIGCHLLLAGFALGERRHAPPAPAPLEVDLAPPEPPPPPVVTPAPKPEERAPEPAVAAKAVAAPPAPAHVGALVTAKADPTPSPAHEEPVDFTNDPGALGFGSGVVAIGGKAEVGVKQAAVSPTPGVGTSAVKGPVGDALTPVSDLSRKPSLGESDPCRGYFPSGAADDVANASVMVTIGKSGAVSSVQLLSESPPKQGFGAAARTCMSSKRFSPGLTQDGKPAATAIRVNIRFTR